MYIFICMYVCLKLCSYTLRNKGSKRVILCSTQSQLFFFKGLSRDLCKTKGSVKQNLPLSVTIIRDFPLINQHCSKIFE